MVRRIQRVFPVLTNRGASCLLAALVVTAASPASPAAPAGREAPRVPFTERFEAVRHGGIARAANSAITCATGDAPGAGRCPAARSGGDGHNGGFGMTYIDVDRDPDTYNSSRAALRLPRGSRVAYARLYWGGNLRVGEQKPARDNGRVLIAEQGGRYKEVRADSLIGHRTTRHADGYSASADVTRLIRRSGSGTYTVAQLNVAKGRSAAGAWGGWTLAVAYENPRSPLRHLALWDGHQPMGTAHRRLTLTLDGLRVPPGAKGSVGLVAYNGDRGTGGESLSARAGSARPLRLSDAANPARDTMNSTIADHGRTVTAREPAYANTLGYDSDVLDLAPALRRGARTLALRFDGGSEGYQLGAVFVQAAARR